MTFYVDGSEYQIRFSYRVIKAVLKKLGLQSLDDFSEITKRFHIGNVHEYISTALIASSMTKGGGKPDGLPSSSDIEWAIDDDPDLFSDFLSGFMSGIGKLTGSSLEKELIEGN